MLKNTLIYISIVKDKIIRFIKKSFKYNLLDFEKDETIIFSSTIRGLIERFRASEKLYISESQVKNLNINHAIKIHRKLLINKSIIDKFKKNGLFQYSISDYKAVCNLGERCDEFDSYEFSILLHRILIEKSFPSNWIGLFMINKSKHISLFIDIPDSNDFWILDDGYLSNCAIKASELFPVNKNNVLIYPEFGFNLITQWNYIIVKNTYDDLKRTLRIK